MLEEIEKLASCFFSEEEILTIIEVKECTPEISKAIVKGKLKSEAEMRLAIFSLAKAGSSPAQNLAVKMMEADKRKNY